MKQVTDALNWLIHSKLHCGLVVPRELATSTVDELDLS
jgi:hypothetical protein